MTDEEFAEGLGRLQLVSGAAALDALSTALWFEALGHLSSEEWKRAVLLTIQRETTFYGRFPTPAVILGHLAAKRAEGLDLEAMQAYERVKATTEYSPENGTRWVWRSINARCGRAAADAFLAAGGDEAFGDDHPAAESRRRAQFVAAYQSTVSAEPTQRLLPEGPVPLALAAALAEELPIDQERAREVVKRVREMCGAAAADPPKVAVVELTDERRAELERQRAQLLASEQQQAESA